MKECSCDEYIRNMPQIINAQFLAYNHRETRTQIKCYPVYVHSRDIYEVNQTYVCQSFEKVYMPKETAKQLCKDLNDGVVIL